MDEKIKVDEDGWKGKEIHSIKKYQSYGRFKHAVSKRFKGIMGNDEDWTSAITGRLKHRQKITDQKYGYQRKLTDEEVVFYSKRGKNNVIKDTFCDPVKYEKGGIGQGYSGETGQCSSYQGEVSCSNDYCYKRGWDIRFDGNDNEGHIYMYMLEKDI